jgi:cysteine desulfurase
LPSPNLYFDWNATTPPHPDVLAAMARAAAEAWANPASVHAEGRRARAVVEEARAAVAELAGVDARDVVFTSGATEANNLALRSAPALVTSRLEHPSVTRVAEALADAGRPVVWLPVPSSGRIDPDEVARHVRPLSPGFVVALMAVQHETGAIQPVREISEVVRRSAGRLHVDAVQAAGKLSPDLWRFGDTASLAAHKIRGPKGIGALVLRSPGVPPPVLVGGSQERGIRPGTVDPSLAAGFGVAARRATDGGPERYAALAALRARLEAAITKYGLLNGADGARAPHVTNVSFAGWRGDELVAALDLAGLSVSSGSACSAGTAEPSAALTAMLGSERASSAVRLSLGDATTATDVDAAIALLLRVLTPRGSSGSPIT